MITGIKSSSVLSDWGRAMLLRSQGLLEMALVDYAQAGDDFQRSLVLFRDCADGYNAGRVLNDLGTVLQAQGDYTLAHQHYQQAHDNIRLARPDSAEEAMILNNLGLAAVAIGAGQEGVGALERAYSLYQQLGIPQGAARVQVNLGQIYRQQGEMARSLTAYEEALAVIRSFGDQPVEVEILNSLGVLHRFQGEFAEAHSYYSQSLALAPGHRRLGRSGTSLWQYWAHSTSCRPSMRRPRRSTGRPWPSMNPWMTAGGRPKCGATWVTFLASGMATRRRNATTGAAWPCTGRTTTERGSAPR